VPATLVAFGAALASSNTGVHEMLVAAVWDAIIDSAREPNFARSVCRNALDAGESVISAALPSETLGTLGVVTRGIAGNVMLSDPLTEPIADEYVQFATNEIVVCLVPSELWVTVHSPYASLSVLALSVRIMRYW
jgi:hypothetical protein